MTELGWLNWLFANWNGADSYFADTLANQEASRHSHGVATLATSNHGDVLVDSSLNSLMATQRPVPVGRCTYTVNPPHHSQQPHSSGRLFTIISTLLLSFKWSYLITTINIIVLLLLLLFKWSCLITTINIILLLLSLFKWSYLITTINIILLLLLILSYYYYYYSNYLILLLLLILSYYYY